MLGANGAYAAPRAPVDAAAKAAREAYADGQAAFNLGHWDEAIEAWQRGFKSKQDSVFLYNIAQAYRKKGDLEQAVFFYKNFLRQTSNAPNRDEVTGWVDQLEKQIADEKQRKFDEEKRRSDAELLAHQQEQARIAREEEQRRADQAELERKKHTYNGDLGIAAGVNIFASGVRSPDSSLSAAVELTGGYTIVSHGRLRFRLGATFGFSYVSDSNASKVNFFGLMLDPTLKIDLWKQKLFFFVQVGLGANIIQGLPANQNSSLFKLATTGSDGGAFVSFEARPAVGIEYVVIPRLSILLAPGAAITTAPKSDFSTLVRVQVLAGLAVHL